MRNRLAAIALLAFGCLGCSAGTQIRYGEKGATREQAYEATLKAFEDCGLDPRGRKADFVVESHWDWLGIGPASQTLLFPLAWAKYTAEVRPDRIDLEADAYGLNWLSVWMNLPVGFPIGRVKARILERLKPAG